MGSLVVVVMGPGLEMKVSILRVSPVFGVGPFTQSGLDEPLGLSVSSWRVWFCAVVLERKLVTRLAELLGTVA